MAIPSRRSGAGAQGRRTRRAVSAALVAALVQQHRDHPTWSYQLHAGNLVALAEAEADAALGHAPSYTMARRLMKERGLYRQKRRRHDLDLFAARGSPSRSLRNDTRTARVIHCPTALTYEAESLTVSLVNENLVAARLAFTSRSCVTDLVWQAISRSRPSTAFSPGAGGSRRTFATESRRVSRAGRPVRVSKYSCAAGGVAVMSSNANMSFRMSASRSAGSSVSWTKREPRDQLRSR